VTIIAVGIKGRDFMRRAQRDLRAEFTKLSDRPVLADTLAISHIVMDDYTSGYVDQIYLSYSRFINIMSQKPEVERLLPVEPPSASEEGMADYIFEPDFRFVLGELLPRFVEMRIYHAILEAIASEQSARMIAMRNATENANEIVADLTLTLNKARQDMITKELLDISGGVEVMK